MFERASTEELLVRLEHAPQSGNLARLAGKQRDRIMYAQIRRRGTPALSIDAPPIGVPTFG